MMRHPFSVKREIEIDECPNCAGYWLDHGELDAIRNHLLLKKIEGKPQANLFRNV